MPTQQPNKPAGLQLYPGDGCGNRFWLLWGQEAQDAGIDYRQLAPQICDLEVDGLLLLGRKEEQTLSVRIFNRDGSEGSACLNGLRVVANFLGTSRGRLQMAGRVVDWRRISGGIELMLPKVQTDSEVKPLLLADGMEGFQVSFWNPHAVFPYPEDAEAKFSDWDLAALAAQCRRLRARFPQGVNVGLAHPLQGSQEMNLRVEERGVGETKACGSGAVAAALVAWELGAEARLGVQTGGGRLELEAVSKGDVRLRGAAWSGPGKSLEELLRGSRNHLKQKGLGGRA